MFLQVLQLSVTLTIRFLLFEPQLRILVPSLVNSICYCYRHGCNLLCHHQIHVILWPSFDIGCRHIYSFYACGFFNLQFDSDWGYYFLCVSQENSVTPCSPGGLHILFKDKCFLRLSGPIKAFLDAATCNNRYDVIHCFYILHEPSKDFVLTIDSSCISYHLRKARPCSTT